MPGFVPFDVHQKQVAVRAVAASCPRAEEMVSVAGFVPLGAFPLLSVELAVEHLFLRNMQSLQEPFVVGVEHLRFHRRF